MTGAAGAGSAERERFLHYTAEVMSHLPPGEKNSRQWIRPAFGFALLSGLNELLLKESRNKTVADISISKGRFTNELINTGRWVGDKRQLGETIERFRMRGWLTGQREIAPTEALTTLLVGHGKCVCKFFIGQKGLNTKSPTLQDWLQLNNTIFTSLFFGDYGKSWRDLRHSINTNIDSARGNERYNDHIGDDTARWVIINLLLIFISLMEFDIVGKVNEYRLFGISRNISDINAAIKFLEEAGIIVRDGGNCLSMSGTYDTLVSEVRRNIEPAMSKLEHSCKDWLEKVS
jgi:hypothetical protein